MARLVGCQASRLIGHLYYLPLGHLSFAAAKIAQPNSCDAQRRLLAMVPPIRALFVQARPHLFTQLYWSMIG